VIVHLIAVVHAIQRSDRIQALALTTAPVR
jgi:hypothetical protein